VWGSITCGVMHYARRELPFKVDFNPVKLFCLGLRNGRPESVYFPLYLPR
jgi:hypothetical protein